MKLFVLLILASGLSACSGGGAADAGPPVDAQSYFVLQPGVCFDYRNGDGGDVVSVDLVSVQAPPGVALVRSHSGVVVQKDFLVFDGGVAFLAERSFTGAGLTDLYATPLTLLVAPLKAQNLSSQSAYTEATNAGVQTMGSATLAVNEGVATQPWPGGGAAAGAQETKLSFAFTDQDGGGSVTFSWFTPGLGFTDLYLANPAGVFVDYILSGIHPDDAGCP